MKSLKNWIAGGMLGVLLLSGSGLRANECAQPCPPPCDPGCGYQSSRCLSEYAPTIAIGVIVVGVIIAFACSSNSKHGGGHHFHAHQ